jgi:hypothetical protein
MVTKFGNELIQLYTALTSPFFWDMTPRHWVIGARLFETAWWSQPQGSKCHSLDTSTLEGEMLDTCHPVRRRYIPEKRRQTTATNISQLQSLVASRNKVDMCTCITLIYLITLKTYLHVLFSFMYYHNIVHSLHYLTTVRQLFSIPSVSRLPLPVLSCYVY